MRALTLLGLGAGLMYFCDPQSGRRRRALVRDKLDCAIHEIDDAIQTTTTDMSNRYQGLVHEIRGQFSCAEEVPDRVLEEQIRSKMGRLVSHPAAITVSARDGRVTLGGPVLTGEAQRLFDAIRGMSGVRSVDNQMEHHDQPGNVPALQGGSTRPGMRPELLQETWSPTARLLAGGAAAGLLWKLAGWRSPIRPLMMLGAAGLVARGVMLNSGPGGPFESLQDYFSGDEPNARRSDWRPAYDESIPPTPVI